MARHTASGVTVLLLACLCFAVSAQQQGAYDLNGKSVDPLKTSPDKIIVLVFVRRDCPISGRYAPTIQKLSAEYQQDAQFWLVYPDKDETQATIRKNLDEFGYHLQALRDPDHVLVRIAQVKVTPEVAVFDRDRHLVYDGRIDNWYESLTRVRPAPTTHELEDAIRAALASRRMARGEIRGVGCYISDLD